jgi:ubiquinol-cytochrome c reductase cytochrome c subunit
MSSAPSRMRLRRVRAPRALRAVLAVLTGTTAALMLAAPAPSAGVSAPPAEARRTSASLGGPLGSGPTAPAKAPEPPGPGEPAAALVSSPALVAQGTRLYREGCSSCHGATLQGRPGLGPALAGVGPGPVDFYLSTGRMPLESPRLEPLRTKPHYSRSQIQALVAYVSSFGGPPAPLAEPAKGDLALGLHDFTLHCAGCHQIVARGGLTLGAVVPDLQSATAQQIAEAVRLGPYLMPHFDSHQIDQHELNSIERYVLWTRHPDNKGGWGIYNLGPIPEGMVAWFLVLATLVLVARLIGERTTA